MWVGTQIGTHLKKKCVFGCQKCHLSLFSSTIVTHDKTGPGSKSPPTSQDPPDPNTTNLTEIPVTPYRSERSTTAQKARPRARGNQSGEGQPFPGITSAAAARRDSGAVRTAPGGGRIAEE